jgi:hypothetical protein
VPDRILLPFNWRETGHSLWRGLNRNCRTLPGNQSNTCFILSRGVQGGTYIMLLFVSKLIFNIFASGAIQTYTRVNDLVT